MRKLSIILLAALAALTASQPTLAASRQTENRGSYDAAADAQRVTIRDASGNDATTPADATRLATDSFTSATAGSPFSTAGYGVVIFQVTANPGSNTIGIDGSNDANCATATNWSAVTFRGTSSGGSTSGSTSTASTSALGYVPTYVWPCMRVRVSSYVSGTTTVNTAGKRYGSPNVVDANVGNNTLAVLPTSSATSGVPQNITRVKAAASTNATSVKASAGRIFGWYLFNNAGYDVFVKFYNKASAPTVGTDTPAFTLQIKAGTAASAPQPAEWGVPFTTGISYAITKLYADSDTTAVVADDVFGYIVYQ